MEINCKFGSATEDDVYMCYIFQAEITEKNQLITAFKGDHEEGKTHEDVDCVSFFGATVDYFPRGLDKHFPNINCIMINGPKYGGIKEISKYDLQGLQGLVELYVEDGQLSSLPDDLFSEMPNLREVSFNGNQIEFASSELLKPLQGRQNVKVNLENNMCIDACFSPEFGDSLKSLEDLMQLIDQQCINAR